MPDNYAATRVDRGSVIHSNALFRWETLKFAGAGTWNAGTILARDNTDDKLVQYDPAGDNDTDVPIAVLTFDVTAGEAGDLHRRVMIAGNVREQRLIVNGGDPGADVDGPLTDALRLYSIIPLSVEEQNVDDPGV